MESADVNFAAGGAAVLLAVNDNEEIARIIVEAARGSSVVRPDTTRIASRDNSELRHERGGHGERNHCRGRQRRADGWE
jgi:hypothetical protein